MSSIYDGPARITTVDYVGVPSALAAQYRHAALHQLGILFEHMNFGTLKLYRREAEVDTNVRVTCDIVHGIATALIVIGYRGEYSAREFSCFCAAFGLLAGRVISVSADYDDDTKFKAGIVLCQHSGVGQPKKVEVRTVRAAGPGTLETIDTVVEEGFFVSDELVNIPFTDRFRHEEGELVLVLAMPLVSYRPTEPECFPYGMEYLEKQGSWSPEVNHRRIVGNQFDNPEAMVTSLYLASIGMTGMLMADRSVWEADEKYTPFRILPIELSSCLSVGT